MMRHDARIRDENGRCGWQRPIEPIGTDGAAAASG